LESEAVPFTLLNDAVVDKRKKVVRIAYQRCAPWQQMATLLKAFQEQDTQVVETVLVQGIVERETTNYEFTNGQLRFDRNVRLGSQTLNRYQIETGNGFDTDSLRIVLSE
jgi:coenzyme F420-reducing hydrogenase delta subunit